MDFDAVLLIAFGGPNKFEEVRPFLANVLKGRSVPTERIERVVEQYRLIGGSSPLTEMTFRQAKVLESLLQSRKICLKVYVGMHYWTPSIEETLEEMRKDGVRRAIGIILAPHRSEASWQRYHHAVSEAQKKIGIGAPQIDTSGPWHRHHLFIDAICDRIKQTVSLSDPLDEQSHWIFTAHSIPVLMDKKSNYSGQVFETAERVAKKFLKKSWDVAYQSRSGHPEERWLGPDIGEKIYQLSNEKERAQSVVVIPIGFVCDHAEILYDLDIQAKKVAEEVGMNFFRVKTVEDHPQFIEMLAQLVR